MAEEIADRIGTVIGQRYKVLATLGEGGMGAVYLAEDLTTHARVAVKLLKKMCAEDPEVLARFDREATAMTVLSHPHIVRALGFGRSPEGDMCLVLEHVDGETLRSLLKRSERVPVALAVTLTSQIADALACAHSFGVVHRDLKPENVLISWKSPNEPWVKVLDFGMARLLVGAPGTPLTRKGAVFGTPQYMPPEQCMGQPVDTRADQYALGVIAFEMLAGERPFKAKSPLELVQMQIRNDPPALATLVPGLRPEIGAVVAKMLAKKADDRFADVGAAASALANAARA